MGPCDAGVAVMQVTVQIVSSLNFSLFVILPYLKTKNYLKNENTNQSP